MTTDETAEVAAPQQSEPNKPVIGSFADVPLKDQQATPAAAPSSDDVAAHIEAGARANNYAAEQVVWSTPEGIDVKPVYTKADRDAAEAEGYPLDSYPGAPPFVRGPYPTMYVEPAVDDPAVRRLLDGRGIQRLLPPQPRGRPEGPLGRVRPRDAPRLRLGPPRVYGDVGMAGVAIDSIEDMQILFDGIPLDR